jgi:hypothetical protein
VEVQRVLGEPSSVCHPLPFAGDLSALRGVVTVADARPEFVGRLDVVPLPPDADVFLHRFEALGEFFRGVVLVELVHLREVLTDRVRPVDSSTAVSLGREPAVRDQLVEILPRRSVGDFGFLGDPVRGPGLADAFGHGTHPFACREAIAPGHTRLFGRQLQIISGSSETIRTYTTV